MPIELNGLGGGAVGERIGIELQRVWENIKDPNTDWNKARKLTITITLKPDEDREIALASIDTKSALAPARGVSTKFVIDRDGSGQAVGEELKSGIKNQMMIDNDGDVADDRGNKVNQPSNVVNGKFK